jgi:hypothetical protein
MAYDAKAIEIMIASPSDVVNERQAVREIIAEWNAVHSRREADRRQLADLISTLKATKSPFIKVEIPSRNYVTAFSTKGMREALGS